MVLYICMPAKVKDAKQNRGKRGKGRNVYLDVASQHHKSPAFQKFFIVSMYVHTCVFIVYTRVCTIIREFVQTHQTTSLHPTWAPICRESPNRKIPISTTTPPPPRHLYLDPVSITLTIFAIPSSPPLFFSLSPLRNNKTKEKKPKKKS